MKKCSKCFSLKPKSTYSKDSSSKDGLSYWCSDCHKKYRALKKEYISAMNKKHKDTIRAATEKWKAENYDLLREKSATYKKLQSTKERRNIVEKEKNKTDLSFKFKKIIR